MRRLLLLTVFTSAMVLQSITANANGLVISNLSRNAADQTVTFDISWNNSWRVDSSGAPYNWDAAWVFVKFRQCGAASTTAWSHAAIDTASGMNSYGNLEPHAGNSATRFYDDKLGVMLRRDANGIFPSNASETITLRLDNILPTGSYDVKVFGIEMVYVPEAAYQLGFATVYNSFNDGAGNPLTITSEAAVTVFANNTGSSFSAYTYNVPASFPKGFKAFYCMKYEITQGQYCAFLNTLTTPAQTERFLVSTSGVSYYNQYRNRTTNTGTAPDIYVTDRPNRVQNCMGEEDLMGYLDWSALRPMTEMEYEKACRGDAPSVTNEYAWGTTAIFEGQTISTSPENGTERISSPANANANIVNNAFGGGDGGTISGPLRSGIFADPTDNNRVSTGATFYGIMEMTGNVWEICSNVGYEGTFVATNDGTLGDGDLTTGGKANVTSWKSAANYSFISKGGSYSTKLSDDYYLTVSGRYGYDTDILRQDKTYSYGGRGVR